MVETNKLREAASRLRIIPILNISTFLIVKMSEASLKVTGGTYLLMSQDDAIRARPL